MLLRASLVVFFASALAGCSSNATGGTGGGGGAAATTGTGTSVCAKDPRGTPYQAGMSETSPDGAVKIGLVVSDPAPPTRGNNTFTLELTDAAGHPITGAKIATKTWMPDHGHGSSITPSTTPGQKPGQYVIDPLNLFMPGIWQITFDVTPAHGSAESVMFTFCIDG
jgi:hypothetical protein